MNNVICTFLIPLVLAQYYTQPVVYYQIPYASGKIPEGIEAYEVMDISMSKQSRCFCRPAVRLPDSNLSAIALPKQLHPIRLWPAAAVLAASLPATTVSCIPEWIVTR